MVRVIVVALTLAISVSAMNLPRGSSQGQPVSAGRTADRSSEAASVFGTTSDSPNFFDMPKELCIVPKYSSEAGIDHGEEPKALTTQQALDLCPQATRIAVCDH